MFQMHVFNQKMSELVKWKGGQVLEIIKVLISVEVAKHVQHDNFSKNNCFGQIIF